MNTLIIIQYDGSREKGSAPWEPLRGSGSEGSEDSEGKVAASRQIKKGARLTAAGCVEGLCSLTLRGESKKVLKIDRPLAPRFLRFVSGPRPLRVTGATSIDHL